MAVDVSHRAVLPPIVNEFGSEDIADAQRLAVLKHFFINHGEAVALLDIEYEVDVVLKNVGQIEGNAITEPGRVGGLEQRVLNAGTGGGV